MLNEFRTRTRTASPISKQIFAAGNKFDGGWEGLAEGDVPFVENVRDKINGLRCLFDEILVYGTKRKRAKNIK